MRYPIAIESGDAGHAYGVVVPDLPGCFSAGDTLDEALANAKEAIELHLEDLSERGESIPEPGAVEVHARLPEFAGWTWALVEVAGAAVNDKAIRINITMYQRLLDRVDIAAKALGETRSGFIAKATTALIDATFFPAPAKPKRAGIKGGRVYNQPPGILDPAALGVHVVGQEVEAHAPRPASKRAA